MELLMCDVFCESDEIEINDIRTFEDAGLLTNDAGVIIKMPDGSEFQVTIVRRN